MDLQIIILSKVSQRKTNIIISLMCNLILKNNTNELISQTETDSQILKITLWLPKGKHQGEKEIRPLHIK